MKKFLFPLEQQITVRRYREEQAELKLAEAVGRCLSLEKDMDERSAEREYVFGKRYLTANGNMGVLAAVDQYTDRLAYEIECLQIELTEAEIKREEARKMFQEASREREVLDKLKEKRFAEYKRQRTLDEIKVLDDIVRT